MSDIEIEKYSSALLNEWNDFIARSRNGIFLFDRNYMDYHADRFEDASLLFRQKGKLIAVFPAARDGETLSSHPGLTFGGLVLGSSGAARVMTIVDLLIRHARESGCAKVYYKAVPHIYHRYPCEEDLYALHRHGAKLVRRDLTSTIEMSQRPELSHGRRLQIRNAEKAGVVVTESNDYPAFMEIEAQHLLAKHNKKPVHTADEMKLLASRFPSNIKLFTAVRNGNLLGGVVMYESAQVAHAQYIAANEEGKKLGALDALLNFLVSERYSGKKYFDYGISTDHGGTHLDEGLVANKESFGARGIAHDFYMLDITRNA